MKIAVRETIGFITERFPKLSREEAYRIVQRNAMQAWTGLACGGAGFRDRLAADPEVTGRVDAATLDAAMRPQAHLAHLDAQFKRVFGEPGPAA